MCPQLATSLFFAASLMPYQPSHCSPVSSSFTWSWVSKGLREKWLYTVVAVLKSASRRSGGTGRRKGLKIPRAQKARTGSIPVSGTTCMPWIIEPVLVGIIVGLIYLVVAVWRKWKE